MQHIILLAFAAAGSLAVQLLAVVLVILTRPRPKPLLWAFWLTALIVSFGFSYIALTVFRAKGTILGTTSSTVNPAIYLIVGAIALGVAVFAATTRGRELLGRELDRRKDDGQPDSHGSVGDRVKARVASVKSKAAESLTSGSVWVAIIVGFLLGTPSPFSLAAVGTMVRNGYTLPTQLLLILLFSLITYLVVEVPIISYAVKPETTTARVEAFSAWLGAHKICECRCGAPGWRTTRLGAGDPA
ncbi:MAG: GAP family protein [Pseudonocardia sp.]|nr:GAP family protein [Pseudonocardia sp.]